MRVFSMRVDYLWCKDPCALCKSATAGCSCELQYFECIVLRTRTVWIRRRFSLTLHWFCHVLEHPYACIKLSKVIYHQSNNSLRGIIPRSRRNFVYGVRNPVFFQADAPPLSPLTSLFPRFSTLFSYPGST